MRVLLLNWRDKCNSGWGGAELTVGKLATGLAKHCDVTLFTSHSRNCKGYEKVGKLEIIRRGSINTVYFHALLYMLKNRRKYDAAIESVSIVPFFSPLAFPSSRIFIIVHHLMRKNMFVAVNPAKAFAAYVAESSIPFLYRKAKFIAQSKFVRKQLIALGVEAKRISLFRPYGFAYAPSGKKSNRPTIITVGRLVRYKRVGELIAIFSEVHKIVPEARLVIVGDGPEKRRLEKLSLSAGLRNFVKFTGFLNEMEKSAELSKAWVFATTSSIEGFGLSALEAEAHGLPVIAYKNGGLQESVKNGYSGMLVENGDRKSFADKIIRLLDKENTDLLYKMSKNARKYALSFRGNRKMEDSILDLISKSLNAKSLQKGKQ
ncbi:MAG: glycosyltransferase family 4 protein [Candidatus Micrarchaeaceae archaeon]